MILKELVIKKNQEPFNVRLYVKDPETRRSKEARRNSTHFYVSLR